MPRGLVRFQHCGSLHFVTFSCYRRLPYLGTAQAAEIFEHSLQSVRERYDWRILGYVVMPEHVHLLVNEPGHRTLATSIQALKISVSARRLERPFWQRRYYDFNVHSKEKTGEKLRYLHRNPVARGLVAHPEQWPWSSYRHYLTGEKGTVEIESFRTQWRREHGELPAH